ncbi:Sigma-70, region 4 [Anaerosporobacter mobilis DSM 15930]|jgi:DNA-directed RNA polymerase specialized sigma24 family protein|uniref:Sigma-70, region 4 n=1 Tax=Anaerosporobacter mobilis DSM 15930 TaxID=1120996 RepID=A0A1M7MX86_9FIRM|nr:sigma factor-like helix-turn-helix DNA-binding protein [Anaerosporobacter mobilis]SHM95784.1 Sigma-70, region 4 [Anaerosporobacter mobilis DSM 15930]
MTTEEKKEYLQGYRWIYRKILSLQYKKASLIEIMESAKAIKYSDMPKVHKHTDLSDYIVKLDELITEINYKKQELEEKRLEIERCIVGLDEKEKQVIRKRYIELRKWGDISKIMSLNIRTVHRVHGRALNKIVIVIL